MLMLGNVGFRNSIVLFYTQKLTAHTQSKHQSSKENTSLQESKLLLSGVWIPQCQWNKTSPCTSWNLEEV